MSTTLTGINTWKKLIYQGKERVIYQWALKHLHLFCQFVFSQVFSSNQWILLDATNKWVNWYSLCSLCLMMFRSSSRSWFAISVYLLFITCLWDINLLQRLILTMQFTGTTLSHHGKLQPKEQVPRSPLFGKAMRIIIFSKALWWYSQLLTRFTWKSSCFLSWSPLLRKPLTHKWKSRRKTSMDKEVIWTKKALPSSTRSDS